MQIIIPMSGFGERFRAAGYAVPKPLIEVDGKTIIQHVVEMFPGETDFVFICNKDHLAEPKYRMREILELICPTGKIIPISTHKLGPVYAVMQALDNIDESKPVIVNYCDFTCYWDYNHFKEFVVKADSDGVIPSYRGFHPHTLWSNYYAYVREENFHAYDIKEKQPFTDSPRNEFASSGTYYFKSADLMQKYFQCCMDRKLMVNKEYYVSMVYKLMIDGGLNVHVYELQHFMQWGTPADLEEYLYWSNIFKAMLKRKEPPQHEGALLLPMGGLGSRFRSEGYEIPKPMISVSGKPMAVRAVNDLPQTDRKRFVLRDDLPSLKQLKTALCSDFRNAEFSILDHMTDGQATTCVEGSVGLEKNQPVTIAACDNGMVYAAEQFSALMQDDSVDVIVWGARGYPGAIRSPNMYGWIDVDQESGSIRNVSVKVPLSNPKNDPIIVGAFTFRRLGDFLDAVARMKGRKAMVNGEYYVDMVINDAIALGKNCRLMEIDYYICWGTPSDLQTFEYWQSCFHKWVSHPYSLENDPNVDKVAAAILEHKYRHYVPEKLSVITGLK